VIAQTSVSRETRRRLDAFVELLVAWNARINLIGPPSDPTAIWERHIADSLQLVPLLPAGINRAIDLGSGAGFPGLILAAVTGIAFDLIESDQRKAAFLAEAVHRLSAPARVHACRAEFAQVPPAPLLTARALAPLPKLLDVAAPLLTPDGRCLFPKGATADAELTAAARQWHMHVERFPSRTNPDAVILQISDLQRVAAPRR
jgi:16S rRNA (guanine527-N7)-methyltransferase